MPVGAGGMARREGGFGCSDRIVQRHSGKAATAHFDGSAALIDWPPGFTANDLYTWPWWHSCGWKQGSQE